MYNENFKENFKEAFAESMEERMVLPFLDVPDYSFSKKFERKMQALFKHPHSYIIVRNRPFPLRKILICVIASLTAIIFSITAAAHWEEIKSFFAEIFSDHTRVTYTSEDTFPKTIESIYMPEYIPSGFVLQENETSEADYFSFEQQTKSVVTSINSELSEMETIQINGNDGYCLVFENVINLTWVTDEYSFSIIGAISEDEAIKIAESVTNSEN